jgi:hypothetical protein
MTSSPFTGWLFSVRNICFSTATTVNPASLSRLRTYSAVWL